MKKNSRRSGLRLLAPAWMMGVMLAGCGPSPQRDDLDRLGTMNLTINSKPFRLWIADDARERDHGLMYVTAERMAPLADGTERGMIFIFEYEQHLSFWMKNTIIPLDIIYLDAKGTVVATHTMAPLDDRYGQYRSGKPAMFAIELNANAVGRLNIKAGDRIDLPEALLKRRP